MTRTILMSATVALGLIMANNAMAMGKKEFLGDAMKGDNSEVALGQLAQNNGSSKDVRAFGQTLVEDHGKGKAEKAALAKEMNVEVPDGVKPEAKEEMTKLKGMSGKAFDKEFASYMVKDHKKDISEYQEEANGKGKVAAMARKTLPTLKKHLQMAQSLAGN